MTSIAQKITKSFLTEKEQNGIRNDQKLNSKRRNSFENTVQKCKGIKLMSIDRKKPLLNSENKGIKRVSFIDELDKSKKIAEVINFKKVNDSEISVEKNIANEGCSCVIF